MNTKKNIHKSKSYKRAEDSIYSWYSHLNEVLGVLAITLAFSALGSNITSELATFSLILVTTLSLTMANDFDVTESQNIWEKALGTLASNAISIWKTKIFLIGLTILTLTASGHITQEKIKGYSVENAIKLVLGADSDSET